MEKEEQKPRFDQEKLGVNPFTENLVIGINKKYRETVNKFGDPDVLETELEATSYTKVFDVANDRKMMVDLSVRSKELYLYFIHSVKPAQDYLFIEKGTYMRMMKIKSVNTFKEAVSGLVEGLYIYPHYKIKDLYWINPHFFFKGSRLNKYQDKLVVKNKIK